MYSELSRSFSLRFARRGSAFCRHFDHQVWRPLTRYNPRITFGSHLAFPVYLHLGPYAIHPHLFFEMLAYIVAFVLYLRLRRHFGDPIPTPLRWAAVAAAVAGAALGAKLLHFFEDPRLTFANLHNPAYFVGGKTIVGALVGGLLTVELIKRYIGLRTSTGDLYAIPLAAGIAIGRIGCFLTGLSDNTYGTPTNLPWAINFGDGIPRHPTQLYEIIFLVALIPFLCAALSRITDEHENSRASTIQNPVILSEAVMARSAITAQSKDPASAATATDASWDSLLDGIQKVSAKSTTDGQRPTTVSLPGDTFKLFLIAYASFRLLVDFLKPYPRVILGLGSIQLVCILILLYYSPDIRRWLMPHK